MGDLNYRFDCCECDKCFLCVFLIKVILCKVASDYCWITFGLQEINGNRLSIQAGMALNIFFYSLVIVTNLKLETSFELITDYDFI